MHNIYSKLYQQENYISLTIYIKICVVENNSHRYYFIAIIL